MKKIVRTSLVNTPNRRGIKDLNIQFYSHDKNNAGFEFVIKNETDLSEYTAKVLFHFVLSDSTWESTGTVEGNVVKATFNTDLIARCEEVLGFLFLDSESNSLDVFKFKFNVVLSEVDKNEVEKRKIKHVADIEALELVTRSELRDELAKIQVTGGVDLSGYLTTSVANETFATKKELGTYATKDELPSISSLVTTEQLTTAKNSVVEEINNKGYVTSTVAEETYAKKTDLPAPYNDSALVQKIGQLEARVDNDTVYDDTSLKERVTALESRPTTGGSVDTSNLVTKTELKDYHYVTIEELPIPLYEQYITDDFNEYFERNRSEFLNSNTHKKGKVFIHNDSDYHTTSPIVYTGDAEHQKTAEYDAVLYTAASSLPDGYSLESINDDNKVTFLSNKNFSQVVPKEELKAIIKEFGGTESAGGNIDTSHFITDEILESKGFLTTHQDVSNFATKEELAKRVTREELEEKHYVTNEQISSTYATKSEIPQPYSDIELVKRITVLENRQDNDTVYDDAELKRRVTALEEKPSADTSNFVTTAVLESKGYLTTHQDISNLVTNQELEPYAKKSELPAPYNDSALSSRVSALESKQDKDIVYNDTEVKQRLTALESKPAVDTSSLVTKSELNSLRPIPTLSINNNTLSIAGGNSVMLPTNQWEIHGTGMPNGVVEAEIGTTYVDKNKTNGALKWIKTTDGGNTGWEVLIGDTGWRTLNSVSKAGNSFIKIRRVNNLVTYQFGGLQWGWFGVGRRNGPGFVRHNSSGDKGAKVTYPNGIPEGFRSENSLVGPTYDDKGRPYGIWYLGGKSDLNFIQFTFNDPIPTDRDIGDIRVSAISYLTADPWPLQLP